MSDTGDIHTGAASAPSGGAHELRDAPECEKKSKFAVKVAGEGSMFEAQAAEKPHGGAAVHDTKG